MSDLVTLGFRADTRGLLGAQRELDKTTAAGGRLDKQSAALTKTLGLVGAAITAVGVTAGTRQIIQYADSWANLNTQLRQVTKSEQELVGVRSQLLAVSRDTRIDLDATVGLYTEMTRGTSELGISSEKLLGITKTLNNLFLAGGKPLSEMTGAIRQLNQGFASGVLRGDEFNSVAEGAPRILDAMAAKLNMTRGELRAFAATGGITAGVMVEALADFEGTAQKLADTVKMTFEQTMGLVQTNITEFVGQNELLTGSVDSLGSSLLSLSENLDALAYSLGAAGAVIATAYGVKLTSALYGSVAATYAKIKADGEALIAQRTLEMQTAKTALTQAKASAAEANIALKSQAANVARLRSSIAAFDAEFALEAQRQKAQISEIGRIQSGLRMSEINASRAIVTNQLTASETALAAAMARTSGVENVAALGKVKLTAATQAVTAATVAQTASARALGAATSFLMGPWGLLIAAVGAGAYAFLSAKEDSDKLALSLDEQSAKVAQLNSIYREMSKTALEDERNKLLARSNEILFERLDIEEKIEEARSKAFTRGGINTEAYAELNRLKEALAALKEESEKIDKPLSVVLDVLDELHPVLGRNTTNTLSVEQSNKKAAQSYAEMVKSIENQRQQLILTSDEFEIYMIMQQASANQWTPAMTEQVIAQTRALQDQRNAIETTNAQLEQLMTGDLFSFDIDDTSNSLDELESKIDNFGGAWSRTGNIIIDAFGDMGDAMNSYMQSMDELSSLQKDLEAERNKAGADSIKLNKLQQEINEKRVSAELSGYKALANGAAGMFSEKTAAAKAFTAISQVLAVTEIALSYQKMAASTTETATHVANEGTKQSANALTAITSAFSAPFPANFVAGAAMIGIMTSLLGGSFGGGGGSYKMPDEGGTGTVLGDPTAQSASISNVSDRYEDIELDQLAELKGIRDSMTKLNSGIQELAKSFVTDLNFTGSDLQLENSNFLDTGIGSFIANNNIISAISNLIGGLDFLGVGGIVDKIIGGFSSKKQKLIDSGITFMTQTMAGIFESGELDASMYNVIETTRKKFWGLSKKKSTSTETQSLGGVINAQMGEIFGYLGESIIAAAESLGMDATHIITTGIESLGLEDALKTFVIDIGNVSFLDKTGEEIQKELEAIFSQQGDLMAEYLVPSIKEYQQVGEGAFETLQRVAYEQAVFNDSLERTGKSLSELSNLMQIDVAQSVITMIGGIEKFAELSSEYFESFYSESQQFEYLQHSLSEAFDSLGMSIAGSREQFKSMIDGIDLTTEAGQRLYASLLELVPSMDDYLSQLEDLASDKLDLQIQLLKEMGKSEEALALERERELAGLDESLKSLMLQIYAQQDLNKAREEERKLLTDNVDFAKDQLEKARNAEIERINATVKAAEDAYNSTIESINLQREAYYKLIDDLESAVGSAKSALEESLSAELSKYDELISAAESNATDEINLINSISSARLSALNEELSIVSSVASQLGAASVGVSAIEALAAARAGNFEPATNISTGGNYSSALEQRIGQGRETFALAEIGKLADSRLSDIERSISATEMSAERQIAALENASNKEVEALQAERDAVEARILEVLGVDTEVLSINESVYAYQKAQDELANAKSDDTLLSLQAQEDLALQTLEQVKFDAQKQIDELNEQVDLLLGIDNSVMAVNEAIKLLIEEEKALSEFEASIAEQQLLRQTQTNAILDEINSKTRAPIQDIWYPIEPPTQAESNAGVVREIRELRKDLDNANAQIGENTARTASSIRNLEYMQSAK